MADPTSGTDLSGLDQRPVVGVFRAPVFNASEGFIQAQAAGLTRYQPLIIGLERKGRLRPELEGRVLMLSSPAQRLGLKLLGWPGTLPIALAGARPVLIHAHFATDGLTALPIARALNVPLVTSLRGYDVSIAPGRLLVSGKLSRMRYALLHRRLIAGGDLFLAVSEALRRTAIERGFPADRTLTHYNGVRLADFAPSSAVAREPVVLHVGRLVEKKGTAVLLRAFAEARRRRRGARLVIIGEGPLESPLRRLAGELELGDAVRFMGAAPHAEVRLWMARAAMLAAPSLRASDGDGEGLPNVVVEAAAAGLPVVGSDHAGIPEAVEDCRTGFIVPEGDVEALADRLERLLGAPASAAAMGGRGRKLAAARFDAERQAERLEALYDRVAGVRAWSTAAAA